MACNCYCPGDPHVPHRWWCGLSREEIEEALAKITASGGIPWPPENPMS